MPQFGTDAPIEDIGRGSLGRAPLAAALAEAILEQDVSALWPSVSTGSGVTARLLL